MSEKSMCAAFYVPASEQQPCAWRAERLEELAVPVYTDPYGDLFVDWGGRLCTVEVVDAQPYRVLAMVFSLYEFAESLVVESADVSGDGAYVLADAVRHTCRVLRPDGAFVATQRVHDVPELVHQHVDDLLHKDVFSLFGSLLGLVYLRDPPSWFDGFLALHTPDEMSIESGRLVFAGRGATRWWG